jgi:hypothetical protein
MNNVLQTYFTKGIVNKQNLFSLCFPLLSLKRNSSTVLKRFSHFSEALPLKGNINTTVSINKGPNLYPEIKPIINYVKEHLSNDLIGAYVHGSYGVNEAINYSDFDGLLIVKDEIFDSTESLEGFGEKVLKSHKLIIDVDPLQHHGWFIITERQLQNWPVNYFPIEVLENSQVLFGAASLQVQFNAMIAQPDDFLRLSNNIKKFLIHKSPSNYYELKSILSQFMLLPTLFYQTTKEKGIFKKESFELVKQLVGAQNWEIMDQVSNLREQWDYNKNPLVKSLSFNK